MFQCPHCNALYITEKDLSKHVRTQHLVKPIVEDGEKTIYSCVICNYAHKSKDIVNSHVKRHGEKNYKCDICDAPFSTSSDRANHKRLVHSTNEYRCDYPECHFTDTRYQNLYIHKRKVHFPKSYYCELCNISFDLAHELRKHRKKEHPTAFQYSCDKCSYKTDNLLRLEKHTKQMHSSLKPFKCKKCDYTAPTEKQLKTHQINGHKEKIQYFCPFCSDAKSSPSKLQEHVLRHHTFEKPFKCECGFATYTSYQLNDHKKRNACNYKYNDAYEWEDVCKKIANILLNTSSWSWQPLVSVGKEQIAFPDIVIYENTDRIVIDRIIEVKRTEWAVKDKDLEIYPYLTNSGTVIFWCLHGDSKIIEKDDGRTFMYKNAETLIYELESKGNNSNNEVITTLIEKIRLLQNGISPSNQTTLSNF